MQKLGLQTFTLAQNQAQLDYEKGLLSTDSFFKIWQKDFPPISRNQFVFAWNAVLLDFPQRRFDFIKNLSKSAQFQLILLSNTNELHIEYIRRNVEFFDKFLNCFDAVYLSYEINLRKPDAAIFEFVLKEHQLLSEECLFIDDTPENTLTARKLGFQVWNLHPKSQDITDLFHHNNSLF